MTLSEKAMLVTLNVSQWGAYKHDKKVSEEVATSHNSDSTMGRYSKQLVPRKAFEKINKVSSTSGNDYRRLSLPWFDTGWRILGSTAYFEFTERMRRNQEEWDEAVAEFVANYPSYVEDAKQRLNGLFDEADYPDVRDLPNKFGFGYRISPMPDVGDFRVALGDDEVERIRKEIEVTQQDAIKDALKDVAKRIESTVSHMIERLGAYGQGNGIFRDSLVENTKELAALIPMLNISDNQDLADIAVKMNKDLCSTDANVLRTDDNKREATIKAANDILAKVAAFAA